MATAGPSHKPGRGILINKRTGKMVDLFLINHEDVSITNDITSDTIPKGAALDQHMDIRPAIVTVEGFLLPSNYGGLPGRHSGDDVIGQQQKATEKLNMLVKFCNDFEADTSYKLYSPAMPYIYDDYYPVEFSYSNDGEGNAVSFSLTIEEIGEREKLKRGGGGGSGGGGTKYSTSSRYHASIKSPTEDGGGQKERGSPAKRSINSIAKVNSLTEKTKNRTINSDSPGISVIETINNLLGVDTQLADRTTMLSLQGRQEAGAAATFAPSDIKGDIGRALNRQLDNVAFPAGNSLTDKELGNRRIIENIPTIGRLLNDIKNFTSDSEYFLEATRNNRSTVLTTMQSPILRKLRNFIVNNHVDDHSRVKNRLKGETLLSVRDNRLLKHAFLEGVRTVREKANEYEDLRSFISQLPLRDTPESLTYYNYYGQPVVSFRNIIELNFERWSTHTMELGDNDYEIESYWNKSGFPVFSMKKTDGMQIAKQRRLFLGSDLLGPSQTIPEINGIHIVPFSIGADIESITQENINSSVFLMVIHTNQEALSEVV